MSGQTAASSTRPTPEKETAMQFVHRPQPDEDLPRLPVHADQARAAANAIAHARATGSVACTYDGVKAERLYRVDGDRNVATDCWLLTIPEELL